MTPKHTATPWNVQGYELWWKDVNQATFCTKGLALMACDTLNACEGLNPEGYKACVEAIEDAIQSSTIPNDNWKPRTTETISGRALKRLQSALSLARKEA